MEQETSEQETSTPGRGSPESAAWFREQLAALQIGKSALARLMLAHGDDRQLVTIIKTLRRMETGDARVSGEMRALLGLMTERKAEGLLPAALFTAEPARPPASQPHG